MQRICICPASCIITGVLQDSLQSSTIFKVSLPVRKEIFLSFKSSRPSVGSTQPPLHWVTQDFCSRERGVLRRQGLEIGHSFKYSAEISSRVKCFHYCPLNRGRGGPHFSEEENLWPLPEIESRDLRSLARIVDVWENKACGLS